MTQSTKQARPNLAAHAGRRRGAFVIGAVALCAMQQVWGAGVIDRIAGEVSVLDRDAKPRAVKLGERVEPGETVVTGPGGELLLLTDDAGLLAVRAGSRVLIEQYIAEGRPDDAAVVRLLRGGLRAVTGWIGRTAPQNHRIFTATATIGIRGTDHEVQAVDEGPDAGTLSRVREGKVFVSNAAGSLEVGPGQVAQVAAGAVPRLLDQAPAGAFAAGALDARVDELKPAAERDAGPRLQEKQRALRTGGGVSPQRAGPNTSPPSPSAQISTQCVPNSPAQRIFDEVIRAYETGDVATLQRRLDPSFVGYGNVIDSALRERQLQYQTRILVLDRTMQCGPNVSVINFAWEKRYLSAGPLTPQLQSGRASVLIFGAGGEASDTWRLTSVAGVSPFVAPALPVAPPPPAPGPGTGSPPPAPGPGPGTPGPGPAPSPAPTPAPAPLPAAFTVTPASFSFSTLPQSCSAPPPATTVPVTVNVSTAQPVNLTVGTPVSAGTCLFTGSPPLTCTASGTGGTASGTTIASSSALVCSGVPNNNNAIPSFNLNGATVQVVNVPPGVPTVVNINVPLNGSAGGTVIAPPGAFVVNATATRSCPVQVTGAPAPSSGAPVCTPTPASVPVSFAVTDAARGAVASVPIVAVTNAGDRQTLFATNAGGGRYVLSSLPVTSNASAVALENGRIELFGGALITLTYQPASGAPIVRTLSVTP